MTITITPTTTENPMTESTMPYFWRMYQLENHNRNTGHHFFSAGAKKFFNSRIQTTPPYNGRVFVTSERGSFHADRRYTVRCIRPDGGIDTIGPDPDRGGFQYFKTRRDAHSFAKAYAEVCFAGFATKSRFSKR